MDPGARGYSGGYTPPPPYTPPPSTGGYTSPRLNVPASPAAGYGADQYGGGARNLRPPPRPAVGGYRDDFAEQGDVFGETRAPRRATAGDYSQAYRDEQDYEEDLPPSRGPLLPLILLFLLALAAGLGLWWVYQSSVEKTATGGQSGTAPVVQAPAQPAKVTPAPAPANNAPPKKLIYDRIVGDREVLGGDVINSEEVPSQPGDSTNVSPDQGTQDPAAQGGGATQGQGGGLDDPVPLPLPPPPGDGGSDQQGSLTPRSNSNQASTTTAAGASQAAETSLTGTTKSDQQGIISASKSDSSGVSSRQQQTLMPVPEESSSSGGSNDVASIVSPDSQQSSSGGWHGKHLRFCRSCCILCRRTGRACEEEVRNRKEKGAAGENLGSKPVVLVPPAKNAPPIVDEAAPAPSAPVATVESGNTNGGGIYGTDAVAPPAATTAQAPAATAPKKKRTIADLFRNDSAADEAVAPAPAPAPVQQQAAAQPKQVVPAPQPAPAPAPAPQQQASAAGSGYVVQLASFASQRDATLEYARLKSAHGAVLGGLSPIVSQAVVGGSTPTVWQLASCKVVNRPAPCAQNCSQQVSGIALSAVSSQNPRSRFRLREEMQ